MYAVSIVKFGEFDKYILRNNLSKEYVSIVPQYGNNITELCLSNGNEVFDIVDGDNTYEELLINQGFKGCKLLPFPNRINQARYTYNNKEYCLTPNDNLHALHGLLLYSNFQVKHSEADVNKASITTSYSYKEEHSGYPFMFDVEISIYLDINGLSKHTKIINTSNHPIPIGDGWHLYFKLPAGINQAALELPSIHMVETNTNLIPNGKLSNFDDFKTFKKIDQYTFDTCFTVDTSSGVASVKLHSATDNLEIEAWQETGPDKYNYVQIYTPPSRSSIAIEPMTCMPDAFNNRQGLVVLEPKQTLELKCGVRTKSISK